MDSKIKREIVGKETELEAIMRNKGNNGTTLYNRWLPLWQILPKLYEVYRILISYRPSLLLYPYINDLRVVKLSVTFSLRVRNGNIVEAIRTTEGICLSREIIGKYRSVFNICDLHPISS